MNKKWVKICCATQMVLCSFLHGAKVPIHENGYWCGVEANREHVFDRSLARALVEFFQSEKATSIVDFGCGKGDYVKTFLANNIPSDGFDGNPETPSLSDGVASVLDLSEPVSINKEYDWVLSLEVGEHLPKQYETIFIENLHKHNTKGIVLSWAIKGQGGYGHFNEQNNDYIKSILASYGYENDLEAEKKLRECSSLRWFKNTVMVFRRVEIQKLMNW